MISSKNKDFVRTDLYIKVYTVDDKRYLGRTTFKAVLLEMLQFQSTESVSYLNRTADKQSIKMHKGQGVKQDINNQNIYGKIINISCEQMPLKDVNVITILNMSVIARGVIE